jgi:hypothetical protein
MTRWALDGPSMIESLLPNRTKTQALNHGEAPASKADALVAIVHVPREQLRSRAGTAPIMSVSLTHLENPSLTPL